VPGKDLAILLEHNGLDAQPGAWAGTAAYQMLNKTSLGAMLEEITSQLLDRAIQAAPGVPMNGKDVVGLLEHMGRKGIVFGFCGKIGPPMPQPDAVVLVIRGAAKNEVFRRVIGQVSPLNEPAAKRLEPSGKRKVLAVPNMPLQWWYEKDDAVFAFSPPGAKNPIIEVLEGRTPSALKNPAYAAIAKSEPGTVSLGRLFLDFKALPPLPPQAAQLGLDGIKRLEAHWGIKGKALVSSLVAQAPRPRKGVLALFDQPVMGEAGLTLPKGTADYTLLSVDPIKLGDAVLALVKENDPNSLAPLNRNTEKLQTRTGLSLRNDLLGKIGPRMAFVGPPGGGAGSLFGMWFNPPEFGLLAELKDAKDFEKALNRLIEVANRELKAAGAMVPPQGGQPGKPGTEFAEFRRLKAPDHGYVLSIPPSVLPTPAGLRPTIVFDPERGVVAFAGSPKVARRLLPALVLRGAKADPSRDRNAVALVQSDPSHVLPELLINLPSLVQFVGFAAANPGAIPAGAGAGAARRPAGRPFRLALDPDTIPDADDLRQYLFPSRLTLAVDAASIRLSTYQAFPLPAPQISGGTEVPVLISVLLPAVQAAREAARRTQCVNNLKQIGLALHNYHNESGHFPAPAIADNRGKPLLSWRVAILPYLGQQDLYNKFKLDEPWDSPHNIALVKEIPTAYVCPSRPSAPGEGLTTYRALSGGLSFFDPAGPVSIADISDGTSNTIAVVESRDGVPWTKPDELPFDREQEVPPNPLFGAGSSHPGGFNALFGDGSVRFLKSSIPVNVLRALITRAGAEIISGDAY